MSDEKLEAQLAGSDARAKLLLRAKDQWADRARAAEDQLAALREALQQAQAVNERDRTKVSQALAAVDAAITARDWLREGRGPYEWDDDRYRDEFGAAVEEIKAALEALRGVAQDFAHCPPTWAGILSARSPLNDGRAALAAPTQGVTPPTLPSGGGDDGQTDHLRQTTTEHSGGEGAYAECDTAVSSLRTEERDGSLSNRNRDRSILSVLQEDERGLGPTEAAGEEKIIVAAVDRLATAYSHAECLHRIASSPACETRQGFLTSTGRFVGREEALRIATAAGQLIGRTKHRPLDKLMSEDLWDAILGPIPPRPHR